MSKDNNQDFRMEWKQLDQIALDMPILSDDIEEAALKVEDSEIEEVITVGEHKRVHRPKEQHLSYDHLPKVDEYLSVPEGEDICEKCGSKMHIKKYQTKEELVYEPACLFVCVTHIPVLECENCQIYSEEGKPSTSTSYRWVYRSNKHEVPIVLYDYHSTRSGDCLKEFLKGYSGYLESDAYDGYNKVENVFNVCVMSTP